MKLKKLLKNNRGRTMNNVMAETLDADIFDVNLFLRMLYQRIVTINQISLRGKNLFSRIKEEERLVTNVMPSIVNIINLTAISAVECVEEIAKGGFDKMVHQLRNIMTYVKGDADMASYLMKKGEIVKVGENLKSIHESSSIAGNTIQKLSKNNIGEGFTVNFDDMEEQDFGEILRKAINMSMPRKKGEVELCSVVPESPVVIREHSSELANVFMNVIINAFDAINEKKDFSGKKPMIDILSTVAGNVLEIKIADNGVGMAPHISEKIFGKKFSTKKGGSGIGLNLCREIVEEKLGGKISVKSTLGEGTVFNIRIPLA